VLAPGSKSASSTVDVWLDRERCDVESTICTDASLWYNAPCRASARDLVRFAVSSRVVAQRTITTTGRFFSGPVLSPRDHSRGRSLRARARTATSKSRLDVHAPDLGDLRKLDFERKGKSKFKRIIDNTPGGSSGTVVIYSTVLQGACGARDVHHTRTIAR
jgi:hypothetical protein